MSPPDELHAAVGLPLSVEQGLLLNAACDAFETQWRRGERPDFDSTFSLPMDMRTAAVREFILLDIFYRRQAGESPVVADYIDWFPDLSPDWLSSAFACDVPEAEASLGRFGDYDLLDEIARGGMGIVYRARQRSLGRVVALKMIRSGEFAGTGDVRRFRQEVEAVAALDHPNIVPIYEVSEIAGRAYFTMRLVEGGSLSSHVPTFAATTTGLAAATRIIATIARAVHHAHQRGILHRDLKPSNILLDDSGEPHVVDFGLARRIGSSSSLTNAGAVLGTPSYMAPEQARGGGDVTTQADVYGLGAVLYELLTCVPPFKGQDALETIALVREEAVRRPSAITPAIDRDLETICLKCLAKDAVSRYGSALAVAEDLDRWLAGEAILGRRIGKLEQARKWARRHPAIAGLLGLTLLLLLVIAGGGIGLSLQLRAALGESETNRQQAEGDRDAARRAEQEGKEKLYLSLVSNARAERSSRRIGQRFDTLETLRQAVALSRELGKPLAATEELRNLAIGALALPDLRPAAERIASPNDPGWNGYFRAVDSGFHFDAVTNMNGDVSLRRVGGDCGEFFRIPGMGKEVIPAWSADGRYLSLTSLATNRIEVWRIEEPTPRQILLETDGASVGDFSPRGDRFLAVGRGRLKVFNLPSGTLAKSYSVDDKNVWSVAHHPMQSMAALATEKSIVFVDLATGQITGTLPDTADAASVVWHPDGELLAVAAGSLVEIWDVPRRRRHWRLEQIGSGLTIAFNPAGDLLLVGGWSGRLKLWNPHTGREVFAWNGQAHGFGANDRLATSLTEWWKDNAGPLTLVDAGRDYRTIVPGVGQDRPVRAFIECHIHPHGRLLATATAEGISFADLATCRERAFLPVSTDSLLFESAVSLLTNTAAGLYRWPIQADPAASHRLRIGPPERVIVPGLQEQSTLAGSASGAMLAASIPHGNGAIVWSRDRPHDPIRFTHGDCRYVALSPDGTLLATGSHNGLGLKVWNARTGDLVREFLSTTKGTPPSFSPDGRWLVSAGGQSWRVADWTEGPRHIGYGTGVAFVAGLRAFTPDSRTVAWSGHKGFIPLVDSSTGRVFARLEDPFQDSYSSLAFTPDGARLVGVSADSLCLRVWDLRSIRKTLAEMGLDWPSPANPLIAPITSSPPLQIEMVNAEQLLMAPATP